MNGDIVTALLNISSGQVRTLLHGSSHKTLHALPCVDGIPNDGRTVQDIVTVSPAITAMYTTVGIIGIVFAITCSIFNFVFRKKKYVVHTHHIELGLQ